MAVTEAQFRSAGFNGFEAPVMVTLDKYLSNDRKGPLLTNNEEDLTIQDDETFAFAVSQRAVPANAPQLLREGAITAADISRKMRIGRNIMRKTKAEMFVDRLIVATEATDTCRAIFRVASGGTFVPVFEEDSVEEAQHRVGDYVEQLLAGGRERRVLRGAAMHRLTDTILNKYDFARSPAPSRILTGMAGMNTRKKVIHYARALHTVSKGYDRLKAADRNRLNDFINKRRATFQEGLDLHALLANPHRS